MTRDGYRPPAVIPPAVRALFCLLFEVAAIGALVILLAVAFVALFR